MGGFFLGVLQSMVGSILLAIMIGLITFILWASKHGLKETIRDIFFTDTKNTQ